MYYKVIAIYDFIVILFTDETQLEILARVIILNKLFITITPIEGLAVQTLESEESLFFTPKEMLKKKVIHLTCKKTKA